MLLQQEAFTFAMSATSNNLTRNALHY